MTSWIQDTEFKGASGIPNEILSVQDLSCSYYLEKSTVKALDSVNLDVIEGSITGLVGESGCGKSTLALSILGIIGERGRVSGAKILFKGRDLLHMDEQKLAEIRGKEIAMIFQNPSTALNPVMKIGEQVTEGMMKHYQIDPKEASRRAVEILRSVELPEPEEIIYKYPHQLSTGMKQRVMISIAIACNPSLLIADEPTSALDVTTQASILKLLKDLNRERHLSILLITHNLALISEICDYEAIMYAGNIMEYGEALSLFENPKHPYTVALIRAIPRIQDSSFIYRTLGGEVPNLIKPQHGCVFHPRCPYAEEICNTTKPSPTKLTEKHIVYCHLINGTPKDAPAKGC